MNTSLPTYSRLEDQLNSASHALGSLLAVIGTAVLLVVAVSTSNPWAVVSTIIYGASVITLFSASAVYHWITEPTIRRLMQRFDHIAILYFIAGTFTPFALVSLQSVWGWSVFGFVWFCAITGTIVHLTPLRKYHLFMVFLNLLMGWSALLIVVPLSQAIEPMGVGMLVAGGITYTLGLVFYLNQRLWLNHFIWHLFVLLGAILHYFTILFYVF
ncbi:hemolysin III family protein [Reinekea marina]|uniref:Hemolysin III family protein n=1 Tax=Reinekea marina TaxID=1310421 RepID=A0ABV7WSY8_9GAMM|nr:hemolysin III family protein [Reinekea marina]MBU2863797.1 hemolysin III family protein [Reinekea forsetii]MDN3650876.1 hemolysin III family protein [Reinekea marina]